MVQSATITATVFSYFLICPRKAWLHHQGIRMEQESEDVALGRLLDETSYSRSEKHLDLYATTSDGIPLTGRVDRAALKDGVLHETKKGRSCQEAHLSQVRFYLWLLKLNGVTANGGAAYRGQIDYPALRRSEPVTLEPQHEEVLALQLRQLIRLLEEPHPPARISKRDFCRKCAFEELCYG
ncbi:CRISPR-associated protein Cas4 [Pontibacter sp. SGAir0037]|uniref:CRISPR-associated protein Cas4 n=1 Tax=Pontibacter sp. SGAir0037 TaxID=2571030 RepID=UPI0010CCC4D2|nr:CRISPR-associated protein Cas4 [Pontibacter sp. SGAir0037]QCR22116.1 CRISPR-associated protein Cas4 [Pontibacter sp. SGAir0037]